jgi:hypothetical protein
MMKGPCGGYIEGTLVENIVVQGRATCVASIVASTLVTVTVCEGVEVPSELASDQSKERDASCAQKERVCGMMVVFGCR